jgi:uncharacterized protein (DUF2384 family)
MGTLMFIGIFALTGNQVLERVDSTLTSPSDGVVKAQMILKENSGREKVRTLKIWSKEETKRLIRFLEPEDVKGVGFLSLSEEEMYLYLPAFHKIRRIASHIKNESFMGSDFSYEDMGSAKYSDDFDADLKEENESQYILQLKRRESGDSYYPKVIMYVRKSNFVPDSILFFDEKLKPLKILRYRKVEKIKGYWTPTFLEMENLKNRHMTLMKILEADFDVGLSDKLFTKRYLRRVR